MPEQKPPKSAADILPADLLVAYPQWCNVVRQLAGSQHPAEIAALQHQKTEWEQMHGMRSSAQFEIAYAVDELASLGITVATSADAARLWAELLRIDADVRRERPERPAEPVQRVYDTVARYVVSTDTPDHVLEETIPKMIFSFASSRPWSRYGSPEILRGVLTSSILQWKAARLDMTMVEDEDRTSGQGPKVKWLSREELAVHPEDPVGPNPCPPDHPAHRVWADATRAALQDIFRLKERMYSNKPSTVPELQDWWIEFAVTRFQIWAKRNLSIVRNDADARAFEIWLQNYRTSLLDSLNKVWPAEIPREATLEHLERQLLKALNYWCGNALECVSLITKQHEAKQNFAGVETPVQAGGVALAPADATGPIGDVTAVRSRAIPTPDENTEAHGLPALSTTVIRKAEIKWEDLLADAELTGGHLEWHAKAPKTGNVKVMIDGRDTGQRFSLPVPKVVDDVGVVPSTTVATEFFKYLEQERWPQWQASGEGWETYRRWLAILKKQVSDRIRDLWKNRVFSNKGWYERVCDPAVHQAIDKLIDERLRAARRFEMQRLQSSPAVADAPALDRTYHGPAREPLDQNDSGGSKEREADQSAVAEQPGMKTTAPTPRSEVPWPDPLLNLGTFEEREDAVARYIEHWDCSEAGLARTAAVDPADLSKWKKGQLPPSSEKKNRIEKALRENQPPKPLPERTND